MYKKCKTNELHRVFPRNTRASDPLVFKTDHYEGTLYKRSPYFLGAKMGDELPRADIDLPDIFAFKKRLKSRNMKYVNLL